MLAAKAQLDIAIPAAILAIFVLLMIHFGRMDRTLMVMLSLPVALVGGMWVLYLAGYHLSVAAGVGFIALGGLAVETATIMMVYIDLRVRERNPMDAVQLGEAVREGASMRVRPVLMTVITGFAGLLPIFIFDGLGTDVMRHAPHCAADGWRHDYHHHLDSHRHPGSLLFVGDSSLQPKGTKSCIKYLLLSPSSVWPFHKPLLPNVRMGMRAVAIMALMKS